jgi:N-acetylneuraminate synthase
MQSVRIAERKIGPDHPTLVVAEIGINHNGGLETARQLIDAALSASRDGVKLEKNIMWFASCWDEASADVIDQFKPPYYKIASALRPERR